MVKCTLVLFCIISLIVMQGYIKEKIRTHLDLMSIPRLWRKKQTQNTREACDTTQFLEFNMTLHLSIDDVDVILGTCSTIEIIICYNK